MHCPRCHAKTRVYNSRRNGNVGADYLPTGVVHRRRQCTQCPYRFTTKEMTEHALYQNYIHIAAQTQHFIIGLSASQFNRAAAAEPPQSDNPAGGTP